MIPTTMNTISEDWKTVEMKGVLWRVSSGGNVRVPGHTTTYTRVRSGKTQEFSASFSERSVKPCADTNGYLEVATMVNRKRTKVSLHRLIAVAFVPGFQEGLTVNHINGIKTDNRPENLEWVSLAANTRHQWESGLGPGIEDAHCNAKLTSRQVVYIRRLLAAGVSAHALSVVAGVDNWTITKIQRRETWRGVVDE